MPSISPSTPAEAWSTEVRKLGRIAVAISCPESEKKLAAPTPAMPGVNQRERIGFEGFLSGSMRTPERLLVRSHHLAEPA